MAKLFFDLKTISEYKTIIFSIFFLSILVPISRASELVVLAKVFWLSSVFLLAYLGWKLKSGKAGYNCLICISLFLALLSCLVYVVEHLNTKSDQLQFLEKTALLFVLSFIGDILVLSLGYFVNMSKKK